MVICIPAPHLGQFERYGGNGGGTQSQSGDSYEQRHLSSALPSPCKCSCSWGKLCRY